MPYRRLPTTDMARLRALEQAFKVFLAQGPDSLAYSESSLNLIRSFLPRFQSCVMNFNANRETQATRSRDYIEMARRARLYVSHVINMGIQRGELKPLVRRFYDLENYEAGVPNLTSDTALVQWGKRIIDGDQKRIMAGGSPIYNPSIALVKVNYERFIEAYRHQKTLQANTDRVQQQVAALRVEADAIIVQMWNEIEHFYGTFPDHLKREKANEYGVVYVVRKSEKLKLAAKKEANQVNIPDKIIEIHPVSEIAPKHLFSTIQSSFEF
jgi:hypothetical protein